VKFLLQPLRVRCAKPNPSKSFNEKTKKEGGQLTLYIALSARSEEIILPLFKKSFPAR
jgi:hypothetical protein